MLRRSKRNPPRRHYERNAALGMREHSRQAGWRQEVILKQELDPGPFGELKAAVPVPDQPEIPRVASHSNTTVSSGQRLGDAQKAAGAFAGLRTLVPAVGHPALDDLSDICDEARQLRRQEQLHHWLHDWLLLHIPLSLALILLGAIHAVMALRY